MCMQCRVTSRIILALHSMTREDRVVEILEAEEEVEDLVEVADKLLATTTNNRDTMHETVPTPPLPVSTASLMIMLLKNVLYYKLSGRKRDHRRAIRMFS